MRVMSSSWGTLLLGGIATLVACATAEEPSEVKPSPDTDGGLPATVDAAPVEREAGPSPEPVEAKCSDAGWCPTALPDEDLVMKDIWPVGERAFAIAESATLGVKVLEWNNADEAWRYIDDTTQNAPGFGAYAGGIWAPSEDEVYYGVAPGYVYHGKRPVPPATAWVWTRQRLQENSGSVDPLAGYPNYWRAATRYPALGIWGTGPDNVYAWFTNTIYHLTSVDGGAPEWLPEYVATDRANSSERLFFLSAAGTGPDDMWFSGARSRTSSGCAILVRKTAAGYRRIADGTLTSIVSPCTARAGALLIGGAHGWLTDIQAVSEGRILGLKGAQDVVKILLSGDDYSVAAAPVPTSVTVKAMNSLWAGPDDFWLSSRGLLVRSSGDVWNGGGYGVSTIAMNGAPFERHIHRVRGSSNTNIWAIGVRHALHKTTP